MRICSGNVCLRAFDADSSDTVLEIRNHPSVRRQMRNTAPIERAAHETWVRDNLLEERKVHLFIVEAGNRPVGIALLRNFGAGTAEIGLMVVEAARRPLVCYKAAHLIGYYAFEVLDLDEVYSYVPRHNARALTFNLHCGLESTGNDSEVYSELVLTQGRSRTHSTHRHFREKYGIKVS